MSDTNNSTITMRGHFNEIPRAAQPEWVRALVVETEQAGVFTTGIESYNSRGTRGEAINVDVYGYDAAKQLAVIQVRQCIWGKRFNKVRKDYYLVGRTEIGNVFAHPVDSPARSKRAMTTPETCVAYVEAGIWGCEMDELPDIVRQGDIAFVPARLPAGAHLLTEREITIRETHKIVADKIYRTETGSFFVARTARAIHTKRQHATVRVKNGFYRVVAGYRAAVWGFTAPKGD